jgi:hypothetical protein
MSRSSNVSVTVRQPNMNPYDSPQDVEWMRPFLVQCAGGTTEASVARRHGGRFIGHDRGFFQRSKVLAGRALGMVRRRAFIGHDTLGRFNAGLLATASDRI